MGKKLGVFLRHPKLQGLPAVLEVPGKDGHGPDASQVKATKKLHATLGRKGQVLNRQAPRGPAAGLPPFSAYSGNPRVSVTRQCRKSRQ